jgi:hypothetical protein
VTKDKDDKPIHSQIILSISNWHFNRDQQHLKYGPHCRPEDVCISLKLSSTAFAPSSEVGPSFSTNIDDTAETADDISTSATSLTDDSCFNFDKNGVIIPYFAFVSLMDDPNFQLYLKKVVTKFEETEGPLSRLFSDEDQVEEEAAAAVEEEEEEELFLNKIKKKKKVVATIRDDDDDDDDEEEEDDGTNNKRKRPNTPMAGADFDAIVVSNETVAATAAAAENTNLTTIIRKPPGRKPLNKK